LSFLPYPTEAPPFEASYRDDGFVFPVEALTADELERAAAGYRRTAEKLAGDPFESELLLPHLFHRWAWDAATNRRVLDLAERALGPDLMLWETGVEISYPGGESFIEFHRDAERGRIVGGRTATAWIALTDSCPDNGAARYLRGSHRDPEGSESEGPGEDSSRLSEALLAPGEAVLYDGRVLHGSPPNLSERPRIGFWARFATPHAMRELDRYPAVAVRGRDTVGHWVTMDGPPAYLSFEDAHRAHQEASRRHAADLIGEAS